MLQKFFPENFYVSDILPFVPNAFLSANEKKCCYILMFILYFINIFVLQYKSIIKSYIAGDEVVFYMI